MKSFKLLRSALDLQAIRDELRESQLWVDRHVASNAPATHRNTDRIQLRTNQRIEGKHYHDIQQSIDLPAWHTLHHTRQFVQATVEELGGTVGHVRVTNLRGGAEIIPHIDIGQYCAIRDRYHLVINAEAGTEFTAGDETVVMRENELWWFDNKKIHSVKNLGISPRTHLIFDVLPPRADLPLMTG